MFAQQDAIPKGNTKGKEERQKLQNQRYVIRIMQFPKKFFVILKSRSCKKLFLTVLYDVKNQFYFYTKNKRQNPDLFFTDYLDEEYVDLDWAEKTTTAESTMNSAAFHSSEWPRMTSAEANTEEGSGEAVGGEEIDDEDDQEGSSKNEAHLSEIAGSGDFGKKKHRKIPKNSNFLIAPFVHFIPL